MIFKVGNEEIGVRTWTITDSTGKSVELLHIRDFSRIIGRGVVSTRHLIEVGNSIRKLKAYRDRSRLLIPVAEVYGFPYSRPGHHPEQYTIQHGLIDDQRLKVCPKCSYTGERCQCALEAENLTWNGQPWEGTVGDQ